MNKSRNILPFRPRRPWRAWEDALLRDLYPHVESEVVAWFLDRHIVGVRNRAYALGLHKSREMVAETARERSQRPDHGGARTRFVKGQAPHNKGKTGWHVPGCEKGWFPKGHQRSDTAPVGAERIDAKDGYVQIKVADKGQYALPWRQKHRLVWEAAHGAIPAGHVVTFKDGNKLNCALDNLELRTRAENMRRNTVHNLPKPIAETILLLGALRRKINGRERKQR